MSDTTAIRLEDVSKLFGRRKHRVQAVRNVNLSVAAGQVYGFLGPNGAGKTTTIRMIMDLIRPSTGALFVYGRNVHTDHAVLQWMGAVVEGRLLSHPLTRMAGVPHGPAPAAEVVRAFAGDCGLQASFRIGCCTSSASPPPTT